MQKTIMTALGALLIAASAAQITPASARHARHAPAASSPAASSEAFSNAYGSANNGARFCSTEPGNPYNPQTDYEGWSAWRESGSWDSRNDCP
jgi:uncharacterized membrane protein